MGRGKSKASGGGGGGGTKLASPFTQIDYPSDEYDALRAYTASSHINYELGTKGYDNLTPLEKEMVDNMDKAIAKSGFTEDVINSNVIKGGGAIIFGLPESKHFGSSQEMSDYINSHIGDMVGENKGYTSTTRTMGAADVFTGHPNPCILHYDYIEKGLKASYVSGGKGKKPISVFGNAEDETIFQRGTKTTALKSWVKDGAVHVSVAITKK